VSCYEKDQVDFDSATLTVQGEERTPSTHPIRGDEFRALRRLAREQDPKLAYVFTSERGAPFTTAGFAPGWSSEQVSVPSLASSTRRLAIALIRHLDYLEQRNEVLEAKDWRTGEPSRAEAG
jgi:hypothetical protein